MQAFPGKTLHIVYTSPILRTLSTHMVPNHTPPLYIYNPGSLDNIRVVGVLDSLMLILFDPYMLIRV